MSKQVAPLWLRTQLAAVRIPPAQQYYPSQWLPSNHL
jgi:hypothetical protein